MPLHNTILLPHTLVSDKFLLASLSHCSDIITMTSDLQVRNEEQKLEPSCEHENDKNQSQTQPSSGNVFHVWLTAAMSDYLSLISDFMVVQNSLMCRVVCGILQKKVVQQDNNFSFKSSFMILII